MKGGEVSMKGEIQVLCEHCEKWFRSQFVQGDKKTLETSTFSNNYETCPFCKNQTIVENENMRFFEGE